MAAARLRASFQNLPQHAVDGSPPGGSALGLSSVERDELVHSLSLAIEGARRAERIDRYRVVALLGEGGFGTVYLAEQSEPVRREVALKVIKPGMDTRRVIARFAAEQQALALMEHPDIARVLDAGVTPASRPFCVMELVRGERIATGGARSCSAKSTARSGTRAPCRRGVQSDAWIAA